LPAAHLYIFSDASPSDWLADGHEEDWHTIVNLVFQSNPDQIRAFEQDASHEELLPQDPLYRQTVDSITSRLPFHRLKKWSTRGAYKDRFCSAFAASLNNNKPMISACSFQEKTLRDSKKAVVASYNRLIGGIEGRGIGFEESTDQKGRRHLKHSFLNSNGFHEIKGLENQLLVLLFMAWFIADQYQFYYRELVLNKIHGFDELRLTVVSDKLSGDDDFRRSSEQNLRHLIDPENDAAPVILTRSKASDKFSGDLLADNLAGWLTAAMNDPNGTPAMQAHNLVSTGVWMGWHYLQLSNSALVGRPATERLRARSP
jgi:hypothetical protein